MVSLDALHAAQERTRRPLHSSSLTARDRDPERAAAHSQIRKMLEKAIDNLPVAFRVVFIMRAQCGYAAVRTKTGSDLSSVPHLDKGVIMSITSAKQLVAEANGKIETLSPEEAVRLMNSSNVVFVDVRETHERRKTGSLKGAINAPRGFLEFLADPSSPTHLKELSSGKKLILYCASGNRSALAGSTLESMGIHNVAHVTGGLPALQKAGAPIEDSA